ncbi:V-type ATP synthase subunit E [Patescibacteria group bacterium]|nr:V-type ATP synthase subunit E [Patescibacteria group bacterium]
MALDDIITSIDKENKKEIAKLQKEADNRAKDIQVETDAKKKELHSVILEEVTKEAETFVAQAEYALRMKQKNALLQKKQALITEAYDKALLKLKDLDDAQYGDIVSRLLKEMGTGDFEIVPAKGREDITKRAVEAAGKGYTVSSETIEAVGGFKAVSKDVEIDNTFGSLLESMKDDLDVTVSETLFT